MIFNAARSVSLESLDQYREKSEKVLDSAVHILKLPEGISESNIRNRYWHRHASPGSIILILLLLITAMFGAFGGQPHPTRKIETRAAVMTIQFPEVLRNGQFFEMRAKIILKRNFADLRLGISAAYWHDLTINSMLPAPAEETSQNGVYFFNYGPFKAGDELTIKIDGQINPPLFAGTTGFLTLMDGDKVLSKVPVDLKVLP